MAKQIWINRDEGETLVDLLEHEFRAGRLPGRMADLAMKVRGALGMAEQPPIHHREAPGLPPFVHESCSCHDP